jgi:hypothetical protein
VAFGKIRLAAIPLCLIVVPAGAAAQEVPRIVKLSEQVRSPDSSGKVKEVGLGGAKSRIEEANRLGPSSERTVPRLPPPPTDGPVVPVAAVDRRVLDLEVERRLRELESCRAIVARAAELPVDAVPAGLVALSWTILPSGRARDTMAVAREATDPDVIRCIRRRMEAWQFTPPRRGQLTVSQTFTFASVAGAARREPAAAPTNEAAAPKGDALAPKTEPTPAASAASPATRRPALPVAAPAAPPPGPRRPASERP